MKMKHISRRFGRFLRAREAVSALEYAILVGIIAVAIAAALTTFSTELTEALTTIGEAIDTPTVATPDADGGG